MMPLDISHEHALQRFGVQVEGHGCSLDYERRGNTMIITHVLVPDAVGGRGIAAALVERALETARAEGWRVVPQCPYAAAYVRKHPIWSDLIA